MDVSALLPRHLAIHLERVLGSEHVLCLAADWDALEAGVRSHIVDLVVVDPLVRGQDPVGTIERVRSSFPSLPVIVYTTLTPFSLQAVVRLARCGVHTVILHRIDDTPGRFLELLEGAPANVLGEQMLRELSVELAGLPVTVARAVEQLFRSPGRFRTTRDLATAAGMNTRTLYRNLEPVGLFSARLLVVAAQLLRVHAYLHDPGRSIKDAAAKAGYATPWKLAKQMREMTGRSTEQARRELGDDELVGLLARQMRRRREEQ
ncbi:MAG TPA: AraC family transcriptional regulator [Gemmatimonadaceae bacterium]|nr:AraC family transcriptional regulator [Gemmatimonadaceae bacterium]